MSDQARAVGERLAGRGLTVATAESCTGGLLSGRLTDPPGASRYLLAGVTAYANEAKTRLLGVPAETLARFGAVSEEVARAMADGARRATGADLAVSVTGIAGPEGGTPDKPVGTVWIAAASVGRLEVRRFTFGGDRQAIREAAVSAALRVLDELIGDATEVGA